MKKIIIILIILIVLFIGWYVIFNKKNVNEDKKMQLTNLNELFPSSNVTYDYEINGQKQKVDIKVEDSKIKMIYKDSDDIVTNIIYEISNTKIIESTEYYKVNARVSMEYPSTILSSFPYEGLIYPSVDGKIIYEILEMKNNILTIRSTNNGVKEIRKFEKGKGLVLHEIIVGKEEQIILKKI